MRWPAGGSGLALRVALATMGIWTGALVTIPVGPVPITLQTLAVLLAGALGGPAVGVLSTALYLALGMAGAPVLADGNAAPGVSFLELKSGGYVVGFLPAAIIASVAPRRLLALVWTMLAAHAAILLVGGTWLAGHIGPRAALENGVIPFLPGGIAKSLVAAFVTRLRQRGRTR